MNTAVHAGKSVLIVLPGLGHGGAERVGAQLASALAQLGNQVLVVSMDNGENDFFEVKSPATLVHLDLTATSTSLSQALSSNWQRVQQLRQLFKAHDPDCIIGFTARVNVLCCLASRGIACKLVLSERSYPPGMPLGRVWETLRRWSYGRADTVVAQTEVAAQWLRTNTSAKQVLTIPNSISPTVDTDAPQQDPNQLVAPDKHLLLAVGRLVKEKAFMRLIDAMQTLSTSQPNWELVILGEGPLRRELEAASDNLPIQFPGVVGNLTQWYQRADLFVLSSQVEGFPNSLLEALDQGCAVVATDCRAGPADMVQTGVNGVLASNGENSTTAEQPRLVEALEQLMGDEKLRQTYSSNAHASVRHLEQKQVLSVWQKLLGS